MGRQELKYLIGEQARSLVLSRVAVRMRPDPHGQGPWGCYEVHSLYLDSPHLAAYREKLDGVGLREKIRLRTYSLGGGAVFLELKQRRQEQIIKHKLRLEGAQQVRVLRGLPLSVARAHPAVAAYNRQVAGWGIAPKLVVSYRREAFVSSLPGGLRFTVDTGVRVGPARNWESGLAGQDRIWPVGWAVAEIKFERLLPEWVRQLLRTFSWTPRSVSKYCAGIEGLLRAGLLPAGTLAPTAGVSRLRVPRLAGSPISPSPIPGLAPLTIGFCPPPAASRRPQES